MCWNGMCGMREMSTGDTPLDELPSSSSSEVMLGEEHAGVVVTDLSVVAGGGEVLEDLKLDSSLELSSDLDGVLAARMLSMPKGRKDGLLLHSMLILRILSELELSYRDWQLDQDI